MYNAALPSFLRANLDYFDYLEIIPDMFWTDRGVSEPGRFVEIESWMEVLDWAAARIPVLAHHLGLSLGSAGPFDLEYVTHIAAWHERYGFPWHSDHLSFARVTGPDDHEYNAGLAVPVPFDHELLDLMADRIQHVQQMVPIPFILENSVYFIDIPEQDMTEPEFLNRLTERTEAGLLLDLHNLYANSRNHHFDPFGFVDQLDLTRVVEMHIAGGNEFAGMYADSHSGPCPEPVWELLERVVPEAPNAVAVTFEFHDSYYGTLGDEGIRRELSRAREIWNRHH